MKRKIIGIKHEQTLYGREYEMLLDCKHFAKRHFTIQALRADKERVDKGDVSCLPDYGHEQFCEECHEIIVKGGSPPVVPTKQRLEDQPLPIHNDEPFCHDQVMKLVESLWPFEKQIIADLQSRKDLGIKRYGRALQPHNGRDFLRDLYEELLDAAAYAQGCETEKLISVKDYVAIVGLVKRFRKLISMRDTLKRIRQKKKEQA